VRDLHCASAASRAALEGGRLQGPRPLPGGARRSRDTTLCATPRWRDSSRSKRETARKLPLFATEAPAERERGV